jgi:Virulence factor Evf
LLDLTGLATAYVAKEDAKSPNTGKKYDVELWNQVFNYLPLMGPSKFTKETYSKRMKGVEIALPGKFLDQPPAEPDIVLETMSMTFSGEYEMGLGAGGKMQQKIYPDEYGIETWDLKNYSSIFVYIVNSEQYQQITGFEPPSTPITAQTYTQHNFPWFKLYDEEKGDLLPSARLAEVKTIRERETERGTNNHKDDLSVDVEEFDIKKLYS